MQSPKLIAENVSSTLATQKDPFTVGKGPLGYQSEAELEKSFIKQLVLQGYEYIQIKSPQEMLINLKNELENLNDIKFSTNEWNTLLSKWICNPKDGIVEKTRIIQENPLFTLERDDGSSINISLLDKENIHKNHLQVINQYETEGGKYTNRYDVTILVNGLPLIHIELKRRGVDLKEAFNQIKRYNRDSFWADSGLYEYAQIFIISNGTLTKYYSNTTREKHILQLNSSSAKRKKGKVSSNSYEFTSWWSDFENKRQADLVDFTSTFLEKRRLLSILTKYCVFTVDNDLLVMRPYQIWATEAILERLNITEKNKRWGTIQSGGFIWHTTGSGKTLTSFKTALLAKDRSDVDKVLFVVDRKDLDYQTMKEYDKFQKGAANGNRNTSVLAKQLGDSEVKIIITTIQKLAIFIKKNPKHPICEKKVVMIFDECHRSQFGDMHKSITKFFRNYAIFGFTGTPIFTANSNYSNKSCLKTTEQAFGDRLHCYTIVDAIADKNVLPFRIDYVGTIKEKEKIDDKNIESINKEKALIAPERISKITKYILDHFDQKTYRQTCFSFKSKRLKGFNSILATSSVEFAKAYYAEFKRQISELEPDKKLKIALIYSYAANEADPEDGNLDGEDGGSVEDLDQSSRDFLENAIQDYNKLFKTNFSTDSEKFQSYYKDVSERTKNREIDMLIVVNMFLTGFDATTLNTLWVDKNLRMHGLIQAFSRTNRILNSVKVFGNIVCFRPLEEATEKALSLFGDKEAGGIVILKTFAEYMNGYLDKNGKHVSGYKELVEKIQTLGDPTEIMFQGEDNKKEFIRLFGAILKVRNILVAFDEFSGNDLLPNISDYQSCYIELMRELRPSDSESEVINDDLVFEVELLKQVAVNIDYIIAMIAKHHKENISNSEILIKLQKDIDASPELHSKKDLITSFVESMTPNSSVDDQWKNFVLAKRKEEFDKIIQEENLKSEEAYDFITHSMKNGYIQEEGVEITKVLPPMSRFGKAGKLRASKLARVIEKFKAFIDRFGALLSYSD